ncbi:hypothetical protein LINGRAHAP2_LOCUS36446 [Linum grandiflorum]
MGSNGSKPSSLLLILLLAMVFD